MAIFVYCEECKKCLKPGSCEHEFSLNRESMGNYINMRTTWSGQTKVEFNQTTMADDIKSRGGEI
tara:strand:+ start:1982 stop:2176 length:195 start_codon:yes stop_codon:yes gene_type:complete